MEIKFNRVKALEKAFDLKQLTREEVEKTALDYYICGALTEEQKEKVLAYTQPKETPTEEPQV